MKYVPKCIALAMLVILVTGLGFAASRLPYVARQIVIGMLAVEVIVMLADRFVPIIVRLFTISEQEYRHHVEAAKRENNA